MLTPPPAQTHETYKQGWQNNGFLLNHFIVLIGPIELFYINSLG